MEVGDHHHVAAGIREEIEDDQIVRGAVSHQPGFVIVRLGGAAEDAIAGIPSRGHVPIAPGGPKIINSLLGLKYGIFLAGTSTRAPVLGLRPTRGWRWRVRKLPNPRISILSPLRKERTMLSKMASTMTSDSFRVISTTRETSSIRSALVIAFSWGRQSATKSQYLLNTTNLQAIRGGDP